MFKLTWRDGVSYSRVFSLFTVSMITFKGIDAKNQTIKASNDNTSRHFANEFSNEGFSVFIEIGQCGYFGFGYMTLN